MPNKDIFKYLEGSLGGVWYYLFTYLITYVKRDNHWSLAHVLTLNTLTIQENFLSFIFFLTKSYILDQPLLGDLRVFAVDYTNN